MNIRFATRLGLVTLFLVSLGATAKNSAPQQQTKASKSSPAQTATTESDEGEKRFERQCGRCHVPPEDISPREARGVVRQMRVRANLTAEDERLILKYLAP
jgi:cytochrome c5